MVWGGGSLDGWGLHLWDTLGAVVCTGGLSMPICQLGVRWCALGNDNVRKEPLCSSGP